MTDNNVIQVNRESVASLIGQIRALNPDEAKRLEGSIPENATQADLARTYKAASAILRKAYSADEGGAFERNAARVGGRSPFRSDAVGQNLLTSVRNDQGDRGDHFGVVDTLMKDEVKVT